MVSKVPEPTTMSSFMKAKFRVMYSKNRTHHSEVNVQSGLLTFGAIWVAAAAGISAPWNYTMIRTLPFVKDYRVEAPGYH